MRDREQQRLAARYADTYPEPQRDLRPGDPMACGACCNGVQNQPHGPHDHYVECDVCNGSGVVYYDEPEPLSLEDFADRADDLIGAWKAGASSHSETIDSVERLCRAFLGGSNA